MKVTRTSVITGITRTLEIPVNESDLLYWQLGTKLIQDVFPHLSPDEREFLMSGITPEEWDEYVGEEDSDD